MPCGSRAMNPGTMSVDAGSAPTAVAALARDDSQRTAGPRWPHSTSTMSRASTHRTPGRRRAGHERPREEPRGPQLAEPDDEVACRFGRRPRQPHGLQQRPRCRGSRRRAPRCRPGPRARDRAPSPSRRAACEARPAAPRRPPAARPAAVRARSASVTPRLADSTTARRPAGSPSMMAATRSMQAASATLEPPNLKTRQASLSVSVGRTLCISV